MLCGGESSDPRAEPQVRRMRGIDSLKVAESRVALDVELLLEAVKLSRVHIHPRQHLKDGTRMRKDIKIGPKNKDGLGRAREQSARWKQDVGVINADVWA